MTLFLLVLIISFIGSFIGLFSKPSNNLYCGIVGFSGKKGSKFDLQKLKMLFYVNAIERGKDSVGFYTPKNGLKKVAEEFKDLFKDGNKDNIIDNLIPDNLLIGHVRAKTVGLNVVKNAHPWEFKNIIGLHNGTLRGYYYGDDPIALKYNLNHSSYDVDSQYLLHAMSENFDNIETNLVKALEEYEGAAALLMYHKERGTIFACHDKERPLFYGFIGTNMYISSIAGPFNIIGCRDVQEFPVNTLYEIKNGVIINEVPYTPQARIVKKPTSSLPTIRYIKAVASRHFSEIYMRSEYNDHIVANHQHSETMVPDYPNITGVVNFMDMDLNLLIGYNLRVKNNYSNLVKDFNKDKNLWENAVGLKPDDVVQVIKPDSNVYPLAKRLVVRSYANNKEYILDADCLDTSYFMPKVGMYVRGMADLTFNDSKEMAVYQDEILKVTKVSLLTGTVTLEPIYDEDHGGTIVNPVSASWKFFIPATSSEVRAHMAFYHKHLFEELFVPLEDRIKKEDIITEEEEFFELNDPKDITYEGCGTDECSEEEIEVVEVNADELDNYFLSVEGVLDEKIELYKKLPGTSKLTPDEVIDALEETKDKLSNLQNIKKIFAV